MILWMWLACSSPTVEAPAASRVAVDPTPLTSLLYARHTRDLPDRAAIDRAGGATALIEATRDAEHLVVRERALDLLALYEGDEVRTACGSFLDAHPKVAAAAIRCLAGVGVADPEVRSRLASLAEHGDPRVMRAASRALDVADASSVVGEAP